MGQSQDGFREEAGGCAVPAKAGGPAVTLPGTSADGLFQSLASLCAIARFHQIAADPANLAHQLGLQPSAAVSLEDLLRAAKYLGLKARLGRTTPDRLALTPLPALVQLRVPGGTLRTVILAQSDGQRVLLNLPIIKH